MRASIRVALLAVLLGPAAAGANGDDSGLGSPSLSPWYAPGRVAQRDGRWFPAFSEDRQPRGPEQPAAGAGDNPLPRVPDYLPYPPQHPGLGVAPRPGHRPRPPALPDPAAGSATRPTREPAWKTRWTPWGYRPNYIGLGGGMGQRSRPRPGQPGIANPATAEPGIPRR